MHRHGVRYAADKPQAGTCGTNTCGARKYRYTAEEHHIKMINYCLRHSAALENCRVCV